MYTKCTYFESLFFKTCIQKISYLIVLAFIKVKAKDFVNLSPSHQHVFFIQNAHKICKDVSLFKIHYYC